MKKTSAKIQLIVVCMLPAASLSGQEVHHPQPPTIEAAQEKVGQYERLELLIRVDAQYDNPFDPDQIDLVMLITRPDGERVTLPAFYSQDYERRQFTGGRSGRNWYYPVGPGVWKARFAPTQIGGYSAKARLRGPSGDVLSTSLQFECVPSAKNGFLRVSWKDPRFLEFSDGTDFFAIGQNLAFVGENQYVNLTKAEQIFDKLHDNGANFLRIWTCCQDWAMAIEAEKSAWKRSWNQNSPIVPIPDQADGSPTRKCVKIEGSNGASVTVSPSHPVALRPSTRYVLTGRFTVEGPTGLRVNMGSDSWEFPFGDTAPSAWKEFRRELVSGENDFWLPRTTLSLVGSGNLWLDKISLKQVPDGPELLWEADMNRPIRGMYNQLDCFMLDELIEAAEQNDIYLMLCLLTRDLYMKDLSDRKSPEYERAIQDAKKFMRYAVARWGYSTNVAVWEYFNEIDPGLPTERFYHEVGEYLEQTDIYHHLRATSTWHPSAKDCRLPSLDIAQLHHYMRPETKERFTDEVAVVLEKTQFLRGHAPNKPALIGEFGLATPKWGLSEYMKQDQEGVHFHHSLWASAFAGPSGTAMSWWWDQLDKQDLYRHYRPLTTFLADVSFVGLYELNATTSDEPLRLLGYQGPTCAYLWVFDTRATWWNRVVEKKQLAPIGEATIEIRGLRPGDYRIEWWDTNEGKIVRTESGSSRIDESTLLGTLCIAAPPFSAEIACKIRP